MVLFICLIISFLEEAGMGWRMLTSCLYLIVYIVHTRAAEPLESSWMEGGIRAWGYTSSHSSLSCYSFVVHTFIVSAA